MYFADFSEMLPLNGKCNGQREQFGAAKMSPLQELPIMASPLANDAQVKDGTKERQNVFKVMRDIVLWRLILS